jgi:hypothetical protein
LRRRRSTHKRSISKQRDPCRSDAPKHNRNIDLSR